MRSGIIPTKVIVESAKRHMCVADAAVQVVYDRSGHAFQVLSVRRVRGDGWAVVAVRQTRAQLLEFCNSHDVAMILAVEEGRHVAHQI